LKEKSKLFGVGQGPETCKGADQEAFAGNFEKKKGGRKDEWTGKKSNGPPSRDGRKGKKTLDNLEEQSAFDLTSEEIETGRGEKATTSPPPLYVREKKEKKKSWRRKK